MKLSVVLKILLGFVALVLLMMFGSILSYIKFGKLNHHLEKTTNVISPMVAETQALGSHLLNTNMAMMFFANTLEPDQLPKHQQDYNKRKTAYQQSFQKLQTLFSDNSNLTAELNKTNQLNKNIFA